MLYADHEIPSLVPAGGVIRIDRDDLSVFDAATLASFNGKPVTDDHPDDGVTPENWRELAVGVVQNPRRGAGLDSDLLVADLLITHKDTIQAVRDGKREVSCGYDAEYEQIEPGRARQTTIIGNHVALVSRGRCGSRCAIQDKHQGESNMTSIKDKILAAFTLGDKAALTKTLDEMPADAASNAGGGVHIHMGAPAQPVIEKKTTDAAMQGADGIKKMIADGIAEAMKALATKDGDDEDEDEKKKTEDADGDEDEDEGEGKTKDSYADIVARAEIIAPGFELPKLTKDAKASPKKTRDALCSCKRAALDEALKTSDADRKKLLTKILGGVNPLKMTNDAANAAFIAASEMIAFAETSKMTSRTKDGKPVMDAYAKGGINRINQDFWANRGK
jgi:hypothetical protein